MLVTSYTLRKFWSKIFFAKTRTSSGLVKHPLGFTCLIGLIFASKVSVLLSVVLAPDTVFLGRSALAVRCFDGRKDRGKSKPGVFLAPRRMRRQQRRTSRGRRRSLSKRASCRRSAAATLARRPRARWRRWSSSRRSHFQSTSAAQRRGLTEGVPFSGRRCADVAAWMLLLAHISPPCAGAKVSRQQRPALLQRSHGIFGIGKGFGVQLLHAIRLRGVTLWRHGTIRS
jgi:hypothetical protein